MHQSCIWNNLFSDTKLDILQYGLNITEPVSTLLSLCLTLALLLTDLRSDLSYQNLIYFTVITSLRRVLYYLLYGSCVGLESCNYVGFWNTFISVYEVECLTHVCIERYVVAKYINNGWSIIRWHYPMYQGLCILFASLYSFPPLFGVGSYTLDFTCDSCASNMELPDSWIKYLVVLIFLLRSVKSVTFMIVMLCWTRKLERNNPSSAKMLEQAPFTQSVIAITYLNLVCWLPIALLRGWVVMSQLIYGYLAAEPSAHQVKWAIWLSSIAPALTAVTLFAVDKRIREKLTNLVKGMKQDSQKTKSI